MIRMITPAALAAALVLGVAADAVAGPKGPSNAVPEQRLKLKAQWQQARAVGGYGDPFSALVALLRGEKLDALVQPSVGDPELLVEAGGGRVVRKNSAPK